MIRNRRVIGIVAAPLVPTVDAAIRFILGDDWHDNLSLPLSPTGEEPATHYAGSAQMPESQRDAVVGLMNPAHGVYGFPGWADGVDTDETAVLVTDPAKMPTPTGEQRVVWSPDAAFAAVGLQRVQTPRPAFESP
jgi:hypothetical protein